MLNSKARDNLSNLRDKAKWEVRLKELEEQELLECWGVDQWANPLLQEVQCQQHGIWQVVACPKANLLECSLLGLEARCLEASPLGLEAKGREATQQYQLCFNQQHQLLWGIMGRVPPPLPPRDKD